MNEKFINSKVCATEKEWARLNPTQRQFLEEAEAGGMSYLIHEKWYPYAWGVAVASLFTVLVDCKKNEVDGYIVTLIEDRELINS